MAKGLIYNTLAQILFVLSAMGIHLWLGRELGQAMYGSVVVILSVATISHVLLKNGLREAASRFTAANSGSDVSVFAAALKLQMPLSLAIMVGVFFGAEGIAHALRDPSLAIYMKAVALATPGIGLYYVTYGALNGRKLFGRQAILNTSYALLRISCIIGLVALGLEVAGVVMGTVISATGTGLLGLALSLKGGRSKSYPALPILKFAAPIVVFFASIALLMNIDILMMKGLHGEPAVVGEYGAASAFARAPFFLLSAFYGILLPLVASAHAARNPELARQYISLAIRYLLLILVPGLALLSSCAKEIIVFFYGAGFAGAGVPLSVLCFGTGFLLLTVQLLTVSQASGRPGAGSLVVLALLPIDILLCVLLIPRYSSLGAALATTLTSAAGLLAAAGYVYITFRALPPLRSVANIVISSAVVYSLGKAFSIEGAPMLIFFAALGVIYLACLMAMREFSAEDWKILKRLFTPARTQTSS